MRIKLPSTSGMFHGGLHRSNRICEDCYYANRTAQTCPKCHGKMVPVGDRYRIPKAHRKKQIRKTLRSQRTRVYVSSRA